MSGARGSRWALRPWRAPVALFAGALVGGSAVGIYFFVSLVLEALLRWALVGEPMSVESDQVMFVVVGALLAPVLPITVAFFAAVYAVAFYAIGLWTVGAAGWLILHLAGLRGPWAAALFGAAANAAAVAPTPICEFAPAFALVGAVIGLTVHRIAYRRVLNTEGRS